jgi:pilus assembly protein CpaF
VRAKYNILVSGGTGPANTTLLNALSEFIPEGERIVTIEDSAELQLKQPHVISLESRPPNVEAKGEITIRDLVRNSLRMRPDRILVGEVRGAETLDMLQAMNTGHEGSVATLHANSTEDAIVRLSTLASMSDLNVPYDALRDQINSAIDVIVQLTRTVDGQRKVAEIAVVASQRREKFRLATVAGFKPDPIGPDRRTTGRFAHFPLPDAVRQRLQLSGEEIAREFTEAAEAPVAPEREAV